MFREIVFCAMVFCGVQRSEAGVTEWTAPGAITSGNGSFTILAGDAIAEDSPAGTSLFKATATVSGTALYALIVDAGGKGTIHQTTGVVSLKTGQTLDFETNTTLTFEVEATDSGDSDVGTATITLPILNNTAPAYAEAQITACVEDSSGADTDFDVGSTDGAVTTASGTTIDKATKDEYTVNIKGTDANGESNDLTLTVKVGDCSGKEKMAAALGSLLLSLLAYTILSL